MAKIGNEAKLIRSLFDDRVQAKVKDLEKQANNSDRETMLSSGLRNKAAGMIEAAEILKNIHLEIEAK